MKKVLILAIVFVIVIIFNTIVFADMGAPMIKGYTAVVDKVEGATLYNYDTENNDSTLSPIGKIEYNTEIKVQYEIDYKEGTFVNYSIDDTYGGLINIEDLKVIDKTEPSVYDKDSKKEAIILAEDGVEIRKGPAAIYDKTGIIIPKGTKINLYTEKGVFESPWYYTEYNGESGWVSELNGVIGYEGEGSFMTYMDMDITTNSGEVLGTLPANTEIHEYYNLDPWSQAYYFTYNGITGEIYNREVAFKPYYRHEVKIIKPGVKIYKNYYEEDVNNEFQRKLKDVVYEEIPVGTVLNIIYDVEYAEIYYIEYDGVKGWIYNNELLEHIFPEENIQIEDDVVFEDTEIVIDNESKEIGTKNEIEEETDIAKVILSTENLGLHLSVEELVLFAVFVAVVIACTSITTIILINKHSKKNKKED